MGLCLLALLLACSREGGSDTTAAAQGATSWQPPEYGEAFRVHWRDGKAELAGYDLRFPRYGEVREGTAVAVFVTEPFDSETRVKPEGPTPGRFEAFKLNLTQDFATGVYDYNLMTSAFVQLEQVHGRSPGSLTKVSFTGQEWCGHAYQHALFDADGVRSVHHSYFEGEADGRDELSYPRDGFAEDGLLLWARGLAGPRLDPGESVVVPLLRSLTDVRLRHVPLVWDRAVLARKRGIRTEEVPAGRFEVEVRTARVTRKAGEKTYPSGAAFEGSREEWTFYVERAFPHRLVRWTRSDGIDARLTGATRLPYWKRNGTKDVDLVRELGLEPRPARTP
ncbi:MAG: hypothetical protein ACOC97_01390 [Myxococcota bacterium]